MKDLAIQNVKASRRAQWHKRKAAEAELERLKAQEPIGYVSEKGREKLKSGDIADLVPCAAFGELPVYAEPRPSAVVPDLEENEAAFNSGVSALIYCLEDCGDAEQGLRLALRAYRDEAGPEVKS